MPHMHMAPWLKNKFNYCNKWVADSVFPVLPYYRNIGFKEVKNDAVGRWSSYTEGLYNLVREIRQVKITETMRRLD